MDIFKKNGQLIVMLLLWTFVGMYGGPLIYGVIPFTLFILKSRSMYMEMLIGFFYILILSDSFQDSLQWAANAKNEYIVILAMFLLLSRKDFDQFNYFYQKFVPFFIIAFICLFFSPPEIIGTSFQKTLSYLFLLLVVSNYTLRCHRDYGLEFYRTLVYFGISILVYGLLAKYTNHEQAYSDEGRYRGMFGNPNGLGVFTLMVFLTMSVISSIFPGLFTKREKIFFYIAIFVPLIMSDSRNSLFAVLIFLFFSYFYRLSPFLGFIFFLIFMLSYQYISNHLVEYITAFGLEGYFRIETLKDASGRFVAWYFGIDHIKQSIIMGKGFEFTNFLYKQNEEYLSNLGHQGNAHNSYITLWLDTGIFGLIAYMWAFVSTFMQAAKKTKLAFPIMYTILFSTFFESWLTASLNPYTIQLFIILTLLTSEEIFHKEAPAALLVQ